MDKPIAWYDPTNGAVSTDKDSPLFTPLGQVLPLFLEEQQITADCPNCEWHKDRAARWRDEAYKQAGYPLPDCDEPWSPVSIGVDMTEAGAHVVGIYAMSDETLQIFYAKHHPAPQRTWVGLKDKEIEEIWKIAMFTDYGIGAELSNQPFVHYARAIEAKLKDKNSNL